jgi:hypothetical protein
MVSDTVVRATTERLTLGLLVVGLGNILGGLFGGFLGVAGVVVYLVVAVPALYLGIREIVRGAAVFVDGVADERLGESPESAAVGPTLVITETLQEFAGPTDEGREAESDTATDAPGDGATRESADPDAEATDDGAAPAGDTDDGGDREATDAGETSADGHGDAPGPVEDEDEPGEAAGSTAGDGERERGGDDPDPTTSDTAAGTADEEPERRDG